MIHALLEKPLLKNGTTLLCPTSTNLSVNIVITKSEHCANKELRDLNLWQVGGKSKDAQPLKLESKYNIIQHNKVTEVTFTLHIKL